MAIKSIRLQNFKGFKDAKLELKPLTVILGSNSAGKSCFGQAIVALSKTNARDKVLSLKFRPDSSVEFGQYSDLVHAGCEGKPVMIELGSKMGTVNLGFGGSIAGNPKAKIDELSLTHIEVGKNIKLGETRWNEPTGYVSLTFPDVLNKTDFLNPMQATVFSRDNVKVWSAIEAEKVVDKYELSFDGLNIDNIRKLTGTTVNPEDLFPVSVIQDIKNLLEKVFYLRPDRCAPRRENRNAPSSAVPDIDDWGEGIDWFIHEMGNNHKVKTFWFPQAKPDSRIDGNFFNELAKSEVEKDHLTVVLSKWLLRLGLAESFETRSIDGGRAIQALVTLVGGSIARPLTDVGFGISQVLPILIRGLILEDNGLLVVEQPEAQLHPKPQEGLADFFCSMVKCKKNVLVETHSEGLFHQLRLRAAMDDELANNIAVYFIDEPSEGICSLPNPISLLEGNELKWPKGFLPDGIRAEMAIRDARKIKRSLGM